MQIQFYFKHITPTPAVERYARKKLERLEKYLKGLGARDAHFQLRADEHHRKGKVYEAEINLHVEGKLIRAEEKAEDIYSAIDLVYEEIERQILKMKGKGMGKRGGTGANW